MPPNDLRLLCMTLAFTVIAAKNEPTQPGEAERIHRFARLAEKLCLTAPASRGDLTADPAFADMDPLIEQMKTDLRTRGETDMNKERPILIQLYTRLAQRAVTHNTDDRIADLALALIDAEVNDEDVNPHGIS